MFSEFKNLTKYLLLCGFVHYILKQYDSGQPGQNLNAGVALAVTAAITLAVSVGAAIFEF